LLSDTERKVIAEVQDLPLVAEPFAEIARRLGMEEDDVLDICSGLMEKGVIRRFGPSISHRAMGFSANPMTVLNVPENELDSVGSKIASEADVTHCYARSGWDYNLFFMIHSKNREDAVKRASAIISKTGIEDYKILFSIRELKKVSFRIPKGVGHETSNGP
jgi:DNA-binding Lrp family transcriptional regulator